MRRGLPVAMEVPLSTQFAEGLKNRTKRHYAKRASHLANKFSEEPEKRSVDAGSRLSLRSTPLLLRLFLRQSRPKRGPIRAKIWKRRIEAKRRARRPTGKLKRFGILTPPEPTPKNPGKTGQNMRQTPRRFCGLDAGLIACPPQYRNRPAFRPAVPPAAAAWYASMRRNESPPISSRTNPISVVGRKISTRRRLSSRTRRELQPTFDNGATTDELRFLARMYDATQDETYRAAF